MIHQEEDLFDAICEEQYRMDYSKSMGDIIDKLPSIDDFVEEQLICEHCGLPIKYDVHDTVFFHQELAWGHSLMDGSTHSNDYNNGFWCQRQRRTYAIPKKQAYQTGRQEKLNSD